MRLRNPFHAAADLGIGQDNSLGPVIAFVGQAAVKLRTKFSENFFPLRPLFYLEPGINKPIDRIAKEFADEVPMILLRILGIAPPGAEITLEPLRPETAPPVLMPDYVATLAITGQEPCIFHVEFALEYRKEIPPKIACYGGNLAWQYQRPVKSVLLLLRDQGVPDDIPTVGEHAIGETRLSHPFRTVRLWELDPEPLLSSGDPGLWPWALVMRLGREKAELLGAAVGKTGNEQWIARFLILGSMRYDRDELNQMLGGSRMGFVEAIIQGSSLFQYEREQAEAKGKAEGKAEGEAKEARRLLRLALADRFPGLDTMPELDRIVDLADLESLLLRHAMRALDRGSVEHAILSVAARPS